MLRAVPLIHVSLKIQYAFLVDADANQKLPLTQLTWKQNIYNDLSSPERLGGKGKQKNDKLALAPKLIYTKQEQEQREPVMLLASPGEKKNCRIFPVITHSNANRSYPFTCSNNIGLRVSV